MNEHKTENYIVLKPIAERFNKITSEITDEDIKQLIRSELKEQLKKLNLLSTFGESCENWIENNKDFINDTIKASLVERLKGW